MTSRKRIETNGGYADQSKEPRSASAKARRNALSGPVVEGGHIRAARRKARPGRPTGGSSKTTGQAEDKIAQVFEMMGGVQGLVNWARNHPSEFYRKIYPMLIGVFIAARVDEQPKQAEESALEAFNRAALSVLSEPIQEVGIQEQ
jgi:hypothetical protein